MIIPDQIKRVVGLLGQREAKIAAAFLAATVLFLVLPGSFGTRLALAEGILLCFLLAVHLQTIRRFKGIELEKESLHQESMKLAMDIMVGVTVIVERLNEMAAGDLKVSFPSSDNDLLEALSQRLNATVVSINQAVASSKKTAMEVLDRAAEMANISHQYMAAVEQLTSSSTDISNSVVNQNDCAQNTARLAEELKGIVASRNQEILEFGRSMQRLKDIVVQTGETAELLHSESTQIQNVVTKISEINHRNTILSINAAIEASRSGDSQSGFKVIASEFKRLAEDSERLAKEADSDLGSITQEIAGLKAKAEQASGLMQPSFELSLSMQQTLFEIGERIEKVAANTERVAEVANEIAASMEEFSASFQEQSASAQELNSIAESLRNSAERLQENLKIFRT